MQSCVSLASVQAPLQWQRCDKPFEATAPREKFTPSWKEPLTTEFTPGAGESWLFPQDLRSSEVEMKIQVPPQWDEKNIAVLGIQARDSAMRGQFTRWTEGQITAQNLYYDGANHFLTLHYRPSVADVNEQGHTDEGFDPSQVVSYQLFVSSANGQPVPGNLAKVVESQVVPNQPLQQPAEVLPLFKPDGSANGRPSLKPSQAVAGVSRFFQYADLHHWDTVRDQADKILADQDSNGLHAFRLMGGLDLRHQLDTPGPLDPAVFPAMREFLDLCRKHHQNDCVFTLLDGAIPNPSLLKSMTDPEARHQFVESLRPFIKEFGNAEINGKPLTFDLVNEIHGSPGTEAQKQQLVHDLVDTFVQEAPGAHLTVGVQNFRELRYWTHLLQDYKDKPVNFLMTFHLWEDVKNLPKAGSLNVPDNVRIGITEADPTKNLKGIADQAADKGFDWMLFWTDGNFPYSPAQHHQVLT